jgi:hypothetical protein
MIGRILVLDFSIQIGTIRNMAKRIAYLIADNGVDGREKTTILFATWDEQQRDTVHENSANKNWQHKAEEIVDETVARTQALAKLNGIDRLILGLPDDHAAVKPKKFAKGA